jgi:hypothetical protein
MVVTIKALSFAMVVRRLEFFRCVGDRNETRGDRFA